MRNVRITCHAGQNPEVLVDGQPFPVDAVVVRHNGPAELPVVTVQFTAGQVDLTGSGIVEVATGEVDEAAIVEHFLAQLDPAALEAAALNDPDTSMTESLTGPMLRVMRRLARGET